MKLQPGQSVADAIEADLKKGTDLPAGTLASVQARVEAENKMVCWWLKKPPEERTLYLRGQLAQFYIPTAGRKRLYHATKASELMSYYARNGLVALWNAEIAAGVVL